MKTLRRLALLALLLAAALPAGAASLRVVTTTTDLEDLVREVGGDAVSVESLVRGLQDPHFIEPRPSFIRKLHDADLLVIVGLELEAGWLPAVLGAARNPEIMPGAERHLDTSAGIAPIDVPAGPVDRAMGDVHPFGNPHYLTDPLNGLRVAAAIRTRLARLRPARAADFGARYAAFERRLLEQLVGPELVVRHAPEALVAALEEERIDALASESGVPLGGWLGTLRALRGTEVVQDHRMWPYFAKRFGLRPVMELEPRPGIAPTTAHLTRVIARVREQEIPLILSSAYFDPRHARRVAEQTGARVVVLAHQVGAREGADDYLATIDHNVRQVAGAR
jgi:ABC-type Zn uptake system ZnuABC Zn-binding protein ZnuA